MFRPEGVGLGVEYVITGEISGMFKSRPVFQSFVVTKPVVTQTTNGYQMKDLDMIFPYRPYGFLYSK